MLRHTVFAQVFRELSAKRSLPQALRPKWQARAFKVVLRGDGSGSGSTAVDANPVAYKEVFEAMERELHSRALPLLVPCPNARRGLGSSCRDLWLLNPRASTPECIQGLEFLGQLLGLALRTGERLRLLLAPFVWRGLVGDRRTAADVAAVDAEAGGLLTDAAWRSEMIEDGLTFAFPGVTGEEVELLDGGREVPVTPDRAKEFAELLLQQRLRSDARQLQAVRRGLATVVPLQLLRLWSWRNLQHRACRFPPVDVKVLQNYSLYRHCSANHESIQFFWEALEQCPQRLRRRLLRLVWGRSTLPEAAEPPDAAAATTPVLRLELLALVPSPSCSPSSTGAATAAAARGGGGAGPTPEVIRETSTLRLPSYSSAIVCRRRLQSWLQEQGSPQELEDESVEEADDEDVTEAEEEDEEEAGGRGGGRGGGRPPILGEDPQEERIDLGPAPLAQGIRRMIEV